MTEQRPARGLRRLSRDEPQFVERFEEPSTPRFAEYPLARGRDDEHRAARAEVNLAAEDWMKGAAASLQQDFIVVIDYGHEEAELYGGVAHSGDADDVQAAHNRGRES